MEFLMNDSYHPFVIDEVVYPTVNHYVKSMSREIGEMPSTNFQLYLESKKRNKISVNKQKLLEKAIRAKFEQNDYLMERLYNTGDCIINSKDGFTGELLMSLRDSYKKKILYKDLDFSDPTINEIQLIKKIIFLAKRIQVEELQDKLYDGMIEDAIYNLIETNYKDSFLEEVKNQRQYYINMYKFRELVKNIEKETQTNVGSLIIATFIKFYREKSFKIVDPEEIIYPKKQRFYRRF